jgi:diguanylate cyclase
LQWWDEFEGGDLCSNSSLELATPEIRLGFGWNGELWNIGSSNSFPMNKILVIEDNLQIQANIQQILEFEGFDVVTAPDGRIGLQAVKEHCPDLIICDIMMPELDGYEVVKALRQDPLTIDIPFIFLTAKVDKLDLRQGMELGADDYLTKPFGAGELLRAVAVRLEKRAAVEQRYCSEIQELESDLNYLLHHNSLTQLPNQTLLQQQFKELHIQFDPQNQRLPLLLLSVDQFHQINETLGWVFSNLLLKAIAERLTHYCQTASNAIHSIAHLNVDQFALLLYPTLSQQPVAQFAQTVLDDLMEPFTLNNHDIFISASIGIALATRSTDELDSLLTQAQAAMSQAKRHGGNTYRFYTLTVQVNSFNRLNLEASLRRALAQDEFQLYYQPQIGLQTGQIIGAEALVRWQKSDGSFVSPAQFIPVAEETGLIIPLGEWVLHTACTQAHKWQLASLELCRIAVNLSASQFKQSNLTQKIVQILKELRFEPRFLDLELTESLLMQDTNTVIEMLHELKALGVNISIDDFGTGYSALNYLQKFSFDTLKIDQCFVRNIDANPSNRAITTAIIQMAHELNLNVIAEGVETEAELSFLCQHHCNGVQGYFFSPPLPTAEFHALLASGKQFSV